MKSLVSFLASAWIVAFPLSAFACGSRRLEAQATFSEQIPHENHVQRLYESTESDYHFPGYEDFRGLYESIFEPSAVKISMRAVTADGELMGASTLYYSQGALFLTEDVPYSNREFRNFSTIDGNLYTWKSGEANGDILTRYTADTFEQLLYSIDPSGVKRSIYNQYLTFQYLSQFPDEPVPADTSFTTVETEAYSTLELVEPIGPIRGLRIESAPLWLQALVIDSDFCGDSACPDAETMFIEVDSPIVIESIPPAVQVLPEAIEFEPASANETALCHMVYL